MTMKACIPQGKTRCTHILLFSLPYNKSQTSLVRLSSSSSSSQHASCEDQLRRKMLEKIIRVDHAGEMGASFIYQGTLLTHHLIDQIDRRLKGSFTEIRRQSKAFRRNLNIQKLYSGVNSFLCRSNGRAEEHKVARPDPGDVGSRESTPCQV